MITPLDTDGSGGLFPPELVRPSWADPGYILAISDGSAIDITFTGVQTLQVAPNAPDRWALGFLLSPTSAGNVRLGPWGDPANGGILLQPIDGLIWLPLFQYGPFVPREWTGVSTNNAVLRVLSITNTQVNSGIPI